MQKVKGLCIVVHPRHCVDTKHYLFLVRCGSLKAPVLSCKSFSIKVAYPIEKANTKISKVINCIEVRNLTILFIISEN